MAKPFLRTRVPAGHSKMLAVVRRPAGSNWHAAGHVAHRQGGHDWDEIVKDWNAAAKEIVPLFEEDVVSTAEQQAEVAAQRTEAVADVVGHISAGAVARSAASPHVKHAGTRHSSSDSAPAHSGTVDVHSRLGAVSTSAIVHAHLGESSLASDPAPPNPEHIEARAVAREHVFEQVESVVEDGTQPERPAGFSIASQVLSGLARPWAADTSSSVAVRASEESTQRETEAALVKQGMSSLKAESLALHLHGTNSLYANVSALEQKMDSLRQLLPGLDICSLILRDSDVLTTDMDKAVSRLICIKTTMGADLVQLISRNPVLLYGEDVEECLQNALKTLNRVLPKSYPHESIQAALQAEPLLIFRLEHYHAVTSLEELPLDIQLLFDVQAHA